MSHELPPLPSELAVLRDAGAPPPPPGFEARVGDRFLHSLDAVSLATTGVTVSAAKLFGGGAIVLFAGAGLGVALDRAVIREPVQLQQPVIAAPAIPAPPVDPGPPPDAPTRPEPASEATLRPAVNEKRTPRSTRDISLSAERSLLEVARAALAKGDVTAALGAIERHEHDFSQGRLAEEREVLAIECLRAAGRDADAQARAARFVERFPDSLVAPLPQDPP